MRVFLIIIAALEAFYITESQADLRPLWHEPNKDLPLFTGIHYKAEYGGYQENSADQRGHSLALLRKLAKRINRTDFTLTRPRAICLRLPQAPYAPGPARRPSYPGSQPLPALADRRGFALFAQAC